ncbi:MAG: TY-Chap domain-containing protein, partial [Acidobacteriota bacterium]
MPDNTPHHKAPGRRREAASAAAARAWRRFERALATSIADSTPGAEITLWAGTRGPAVEIGVFLDEDVEVKAFERACGPGRRAGKDQARRLAALGFERVEQEGPDDEPPCALSCFRRPMVHPVAGKDVAALAVVVLREVMGFAAPSALQYSATAMVPQNVALPGLGLEQLQALFGGGEDVDLHGPGKPTLRRQVAELVKARTGRRSVRYTKEGVLRIQGEDAEVVLLVD